MIQRLPQFLPPRTVGFLAPRKTDNAVIRRHLFLFVQVVKGGNELARRQVPAGSKDDNGTSFGYFAPLGQWTACVLIRNEGFVHGQTMGQRYQNFNQQSAPGRTDPNMDLLNYVR